jgi:hypothetical protein
VRNPDSDVYRTAFDFKVKEAEYFVGQILAIKKQIGEPFLDEVFSESIQNRVAEAVQQKCDVAAFCYDALLGAAFSALDCFARAHSTIAKGAKRGSGRPLTMRHISFSQWIGKLRNLIKAWDEAPADKTARPDGIEGNVPDIEDLRAILRLDKERFSKHRKMRNFYMHERHPIQDCDGDSIVTSAGRISEVRLPLFWHKARPVSYMDAGSQEILEDLRWLSTTPDASGRWFLTFD